MEDVNVKSTATADSLEESESDNKSSEQTRTSSQEEDEKSVRSHANKQQNEPDQIKEANSEDLEIIEKATAVMSITDVVDPSTNSTSNVEQQIENEQGKEEICIHSNISQSMDEDEEMMMISGGEAVGENHISAKVSTTDDLMMDSGIASNSEHTTSSSSSSSCTDDERCSSSELASTPTTTYSSSLSCSTSTTSSVIPSTTSTKGGRMPDADAIKMFVGQIPKDWSETECRDLLFSAFGDIHSLRVLRDKETGQSRGCCFVTFFTRKAALAAQDALHNVRTLPSMHNPIQMKPADNENRQERKIFIGMLCKKFGETEVRSMFAQYGNIEECMVLRDANGFSRGKFLANLYLIKIKQK